MSGKRHISMPSQVADDLWHEFILYTRDYDAFCRRAFGGFLHHTPAVVLSEHRKSNEGLRRASLAECVVDDKNVLTWRSIVNRVWQYHFGKGLVETPSDFGHNGAKPSHPELLDWLACEFRDADSFKRLHKLIVLSCTYRQSSKHNAAHAKIDADNRYLWRMNRQRLDAESIRDAVLFVSGPRRLIVRASEMFAAVGSWKRSMKSWVFSRIREAPSDGVSLFAGTVGSRNRGIR